MCSLLESSCSRLLDDNPPSCTSSWSALWSNLFWVWVITALHNHMQSHQSVTKTALVSTGQISCFSVNHICLLHGLTALVTHSYMWQTLKSFSSVISVWWAHKVQQKFLPLGPKHTAFKLTGFTPFLLLRSSRLFFFPFRACTWKCKVIRCLKPLFSRPGIAC